jgi:glyoxylase-like metal-dependent hydrolase (beta-lactamase superfamily II)
VPESNLRIAEGDVLGWEAFPSPGHASHHVCYLRDGLLLAGDACGVRPQPAVYVLPVSPPPDVDVEAWHATIAEIERRRPERLALIHFGIAADAAEHLARLGDELDRWAAVVRDGASEEEFGAFARDRIGADAELYDQVAPLSQSWQGLRRYWDKRDAAEAAARATS